jgi:hypothetical protein
VLPLSNSLGLYFGFDPGLEQYNDPRSGRLALVSICEIDVTSFSEDGRGVKWLCN